jgi:hypothetical protein
VITRGGSGAPSAGPSGEPARPGDARGQAVDLAEIRRTDMVVDLLASRRLVRPRLLGDPVITLLSSLTRDVDTPSPGRSGAPRGAGRRYAGAHRRRAGPWWQAAAAVMIVLASAMAVAALMLAGMLTRLPGVGGSGRQGH